MAISDYLRDLRSKVGPTLLVVPSVTGFILDDAGRVLLVQVSNGGVWVAPGGAVDPDEAPQDAVVREVWEETGLHVEPTRLCGVFGGPEFRVTYENGDETNYVMAVYECRRIGGTLRPDGDETIDVRFFSAAELATIPLASWARVVLPALMSRTDHRWIPPVTWTPARDAKDAGMPSRADRACTTS
jgi:8-oxo-dGTP pyrophosphatase MutT (NUDIX family)